jgi:hypothetical protein
MSTSNASQLAQRYVSDELTHFVGSALPSEEAQFRLLLKILGEGLLLRSPDLTGVEAGRQSSEGFEVSIDPTKPLSENEQFLASVVCFCDIPVEDMAIHMRHFSRFGIAFKKRFLLELGASPVFYVAREASTAPPDEEAHRAQLFDQRFEGFHEIFSVYREQLPEHRSSTRRVQVFLSKYVFAFMKFFDASADVDDRRNHYMEREWRILGNVRFDLTDVRRIIVPEKYGGRLREEVPEYIGQISFAPEMP